MLRNQRIGFKRRAGRARASEKDARAPDEGRDDVEATSSMQDSARSARRDKCSDKNLGRSRKVKVSMATVLAITLLAVYCFLLGFALGQQNCSLSGDSNGAVGKIDESEQRSDEQSSIETTGSESPRKQISIGNETYEILPPPDDWETFSYTDIRRHFTCGTYAHFETKRLYSEEQWQYMRDRYNELVDDRVKFDDPVPPTLGYTLLDNRPPPFYAKLSPGKGRGVFASRKIKKGRVVHHGDPSAVEFNDAAAWRRFVFSMPRTMACDVAEWTWTQKLSKEGRFRMLMDMNIAALFNNGGNEHFNVIPKDKHSLIFYAIRDIEKDSELLFTYDIYETNWEAVGLGNNK